jgi:predicted secreted protein
MEDLPDHLDLRVGQSRSLVLPSLGTSGYVWQEEVVGQPGVADVSLARGFPPGTQPPAVGVSAPETLTIRALEPGEATLLLRQARPWEHDQPPIREAQITVSVTAAN